MIVMVLLDGPRAVQAHFTAPSSVRRKLMSSPLNKELKTKYGVRPCDSSRSNIPAMFC